MENDYENMLIDQREYRERLERDKEVLAKLKKEEDSLSLYKKARRFVKNTGLELVASGLDAIFSPFMLGGLRIQFDGIREMKQSNKYNEQRTAFNEMHFPQRA